MSKESVVTGINSTPGSEDAATNDDQDIRSSGRSYHLVAEQALCLEKNYITDMDVKRCNGNSQFAVALTSKTCMVYSLSNNQFNLLSTLKGHEQPVTNVKFCSKSDSLVLSSSLDGKVRLWDLRKDNCVKELQDESTVKPLTCFDISCDDRFVCAGTELVGGDAFILFWDIRARKLLGGYWESHMDDITQIAFHPKTADMVATGSTDGLINVFDISKSSEEDALRHSLNTESSVAKIRWHNDEYLSCLTHTEAVQLWNIEGARPEEHFMRKDIAAILQRPNSDDCYVVDIHQRSNNDFFALAGSNCGKGECLKTINIKKSKLSSAIDFIGNRQIVRTSSYNSDDQLLFTAGESCCISVWKQGTEENRLGSGFKKLSKARNKHKAKPY